MQKIIALIVLTIAVVFFTTTVSANNTSARIRLIHLSPNAPAVDLANKDANTLISNISFKQTSDYVEITPGTYNLDLKVAGTPNVVIQKSNVNLQPNKSYSVYVTGILNGTPALQATIINDSDPSSTPPTIPIFTSPSNSIEQRSEDDEKKLDKKSYKKELKQQEKVEKQKLNAQKSEKDDDDDDDDENENDD